MSNWRERAACIGSDTEMFFPERNEWFIADRAKELCKTCPVVEDCLSWALRLDVRDGVFGGMTAAERTKFRRRTA